MKIGFLDSTCWWVYVYGRLYIDDLLWVVSLDLRNLLYIIFNSIKVLCFLVSVYSNTTVFLLQLLWCCVWKSRIGNLWNRSSYTSKLQFILFFSWRKTGKRSTIGEWLNRDYCFIFLLNAQIFYGILDFSVLNENQCFTVVSFLVEWVVFCPIWCEFLVLCTALPISSLFPFLYFMVSLTIKRALLQLLSVHSYLFLVLEVKF